MFKKAKVNNSLISKSKTKGAFVSKNSMSSKGGVVGVKKFGGRTLNFSSIKEKMKSQKPMDKWLFFAVLALVGFGCLMVYSASYYDASLHHGDSWFFAKKQIFGAVIGLICMFLLSYVNFNLFKRFWLWFVLVGFALLVIVLIPAFSLEVLGARRWIALPGFTIQPAEIAKFCFVFFAAWFFSQKTKKHGSIFSCWPVFLVALVYGALILLQPNMSTVMCIFIVLAIMLFAVGLNKVQFGLLGLPAIGGVVGLIIAEPYRLRRLTAFLNPWDNALEEGFQLIQSLYSLASGGMFGVGLFNSRQKLLFLPFSESDFIFSIIGEEFGFLGVALVILMFLFVAYRGIKIALNAENRFGCYLAVGVSMTIVVQALVNIAVVSGSIPPTGLPLPFISSGSTSLIVFMSAVGVLLNVSRRKSVKG